MHYPFGVRDSTPKPHACKARAFPLSYFPNPMMLNCLMHFSEIKISLESISKCSLPMKFELF